MKSPACILFLIIFQSFNSNCLGQIVINLENLSTYSNLDGFSIGLVSYPKNTGAELGELIINNKMQPIFTKKNIQESIALFISKKYSQTNSSPKINLRIEETFIKEKFKTKTLITGELYLKISFYSDFQNQEKQICSSYSTIKYERSHNNLNVDILTKDYQKLIVNCLSYLSNYLKVNKQFLENFSTDSQVLIKPYFKKNSLDTIYYGTKNLTWQDFKAKPNYQSKYGATIFPSIAIDTKIGVRDHQIIAEITPKVYMVPNMSWVLDKAKTDEALKHEQVHFDITKIVMDRLIEKFKLLKASSIDDLQSMINYEYLESYKEMNRLQNAYDTETNHSLIKHKQMEWEQKVEKWLQNPSLANL